MNTKLKEGESQQLQARGIGTDRVCSTLELYGRRALIISDGKIFVPENGHAEPSRLMDIAKPALSSRAFKPDDTVVDVSGVRIGGSKTVVIAGPCSVESEEQLLEVAVAVKRAGATMLRGGAYKPRTSPFSFQGLGVEGLKILKRVGERVGLPVVSEIMSESDMGRFMDNGIDMAQVGARSMQCFPLLAKLGESGIPTMLKRGPGNKIEEWLLASEYLLAKGNGNVVLCERGIARQDNTTRYTMDIGSISGARHETHLPIIADPSHSAGKAMLVADHALAALAAGAKGLMIEVHPNPKAALSDSAQQLTPDQFEELMATAKAVARALGREI